MPGVTFPGGVRADGLPAALSDPARLAAVAATGLLDTGPEPEFESLARLAATVTGCGRAFITLVDDRRSFWKSCVGVDATRTDERQNHVRESFCYFLVGLEGDSFAVEDAALDPRTRDHPSVTPMKIGAWAYHPILGPGGEVLGSMCVIDENPRVWQPQELAVLETMARSVSNEMNLRLSLATAQQALAASSELARSLQDSLLPPVLRPVPGLDTAASYLPAAAWHGGRRRLLRPLPRQGLLVVHRHGRRLREGHRGGQGHRPGPLHPARGGHPAALPGHRAHAPELRTARPAGRRRPVPHRCVRHLPPHRGRARRTPVHGRASPALIRRDDGRIQSVGRPGTLLGILPEVRLTDVRFRLAAGDTLLLYTDGATEARPRAATPGGKRPLFDEADLAAALAATHGADATETVRHLGQVLADHTGGWASDDTALLALRVPPTS